MVYCVLRIVGGKFYNCRLSVVNCPYTVDTTKSDQVGLFAQYMFIVGFMCIKAQAFVFSLH